MDEEIRLINQNTRKQKIQKYILKYKKEIYIFIFIIIISIFFFLFYNEYQKKNYTNLTNKFNYALTNYNKETRISEIQKFSFPKWTFEYSIQCNKKTYFDNFKLDKKKYFLIHKFNYYDFFSRK